jgi:hypothetical protein
MLEVQEQEQRACHDIVTVDDSWFYYHTDHESIWLRSGEQVRERTCVSVSVQCKKLMVTIARVLNPTGFHGIRVLPKGCKFNSSYHQNAIFEPLSEWQSGQAGAAGGTLIVYANNAHPLAAGAAAAAAGHIAAFHGRERDGKKPSPTLLAGFGTF